MRNRKKLQPGLKLALGFMLLIAIGTLLLYLPARTAQILRRKKPEEIGISEPSEKVEKAPGKKTDAKPAAGKKAATKPATRAPRAKKESGK